MSEMEFVRARAGGRLVFPVDVEDEYLLDEYIALVAGVGC